MNVVQMRNNFLQMSDRIQHRPLHAVRDIHETQELSSPQVRFSGDSGTGTSSLWGTGLIVDGRSGYFIVCVDLEMIPVMFIKQIGWLVFWFPPDHWKGEWLLARTICSFCEKPHTLCNKYEGPNLYLCLLLYTQNEAHNHFFMSGVKFPLWDSQVTVHHTRKRRCQDDLNCSLARWKYNKHNPFA